MLAVSSRGSAARTAVPLGGHRTDRRRALHAASPSLPLPPPPLTYAAPPNGTATGGSSSLDAPGTNRRAVLSLLLLPSVTATAAALAPTPPALAVIGTDDAGTVVNSVLGAYGLPSLPGAKGGGAKLRPYDEFADAWTFEYPSAWVARPNTLRRGVVVSDFQSADKASVEEVDWPPAAGGADADADVEAAAITAAVLPGGGRLTQDDVLSLPPRRLVKRRAAEVDGQEYLYLEFPSETVTRSGYQVQRANLVAAAVRKGKLYVLAASARSDRYDAAKRALLLRVVESFRVR